EALLPCLIVHLAAVRLEPGDVGDAAAVNRLPLEPAPAPERRMLPAKPDQTPGELEQILVRMLPVEPRGLVVLAVRVVVPALGARYLVAAQDHRNALRQQQRREEIPALPRPAVEDSGIVGRPFRAAVPRAVVALAVAVLLPIGLVVLLVVRDEVVQREPVV